jgi:hypothetical protein
MDALTFAHIAEKEEQVVDVVRQAINRCRELPKEKNIMTIIWHDCALKMKKRRRYPEVLEFLTSLKDAEIVRGIDLYERIEKENL